MGGPRWTKADRQALRALAKEGASQQDAAAELGRTHRAVRCQAQRAGVHFRRGPERNLQRRLDVLDFCGQGMTLCAAARQMGVHFKYVWWLAQELVRDGLLRREGGASRACRYVPVKDDGRG